MKFCTLSKLKCTILLILCIGISFQSFSQDDMQQNEFWKNVSYGGGIGLSFGDGFFSGTLAPNAIYQFNRDIGLGLGLNGTYNSLKNSYSSTILGASIISLYNPFDQLQVSGEFEQLNVSQKSNDNSFEDSNYWVPALFMGLGYRTNNVTFGIRYDVLYNKGKSVYADAWAPFVRVLF